MGTSEKMKIHRIMNIGDAISLIDDINYLPAKIAYRLGRLGDHCSSVIKPVSKLEQNARKKAINEQNEFRKGFDSLSDEEKEEVKKKIATSNEEFVNYSESLMDQEEEIKIPDLKLSDFTAESEIKLKDRTIKAGETLVPVKFFKLMGEIIKE